MTSRRFQLSKVPGTALPIARAAALAAVSVVLASVAAHAQQSSPPAPETGAPAGTMMLTIFLRHDQSKPLDQLNAELQRQGFYKAFPPPGVEVVSWYVMMGIGQVVTLRFPAEKLREVNLSIERTAWGPYRTEFYPTYDYKAVGEAAHAKAQ